MKPHFSYLVETFQIQDSVSGCAVSTGREENSVCGRRSDGENRHDGSHGIPARWRSLRSVLIDSSFVIRSLVLNFLKLLYYFGRIDNLKVSTEYCFVIFSVQFVFDNTVAVGVE